MRIQKMLKISKINAQISREFLFLLPACFYNLIFVESIFIKSPVGNLRYIFLNLIFRTAIKFY